MQQVVDQAVREELLNPHQSYIVQAPAGSGKTELLTQRILALLSVSEKPENILAITFTRKAAGEMKSRVISALELAQQDEPLAAHEKQRWQLARKVLNRDKEKHWQLLENSSRLNITTIDSLAASLSSALPLLSQTGALPKIAENAMPYYQEAANDLLASVSDEDEIAEHLLCLLNHKDNNYIQVSELMAQMLAKRLQWFASIKAHSREFDAEQLAKSLKIIVGEKLQQAYKKIPLNIIAELPALLNQAASVLADNNKLNKPNLLKLHDVESIKMPVYSDLTLWKGIAELFLKASDKVEILSSFNKSNGFPTVKDAANETQAKSFKVNKKIVSEIASELAQSDEVPVLLQQIKLLPDNVDDSLAQQSLRAVVALLPVALAHLKLVFSRYNVIDFSELSLASIEALGHPEMPSDLALALDYRMEHILIDEFQDTSSPQIELIKLLTAGWEKDSARSLFLVGDPMQSIYRFRDANVSLFMQICEQGIGHIKPLFRQLKVNFRSSETIVNWVNHQFENIMPTNDDMTFSAVSYAQSVAFNLAQSGSQVECFFTLEQNDHWLQAQQVLKLVNQHLDSNRQNKENKTLAILARNRNHFNEIIFLLNQHQISFQAVEIDKLSEKIIVKDILSLAFALTDPFDQLSWCAIMRSPWFGLSLRDIHHVLTTTHVEQAMPERINQAAQDMPSDSQQRVAKILPILNVTIQYKGRKPFRDWLLGCFSAVGGLMQLDLESDHQDLQVCVDELAKLSEGGELIDRQQIDDAIGRLFAAPNPHADNQIQIMTIHKSKGLEFDTVILPRLDSGSRAGDTTLLKWTEVIDQSGESHNLIGISKETGKEHDVIYNYISYLDKEKSRYEEQRLLYVAATRAKQKLYLLGNLKADTKQTDEFKPPSANSFLSMLWPGINNEFNKITESTIGVCQMPIEDIQIGNIETGDIEIEDIEIENKVDSRKSPDNQPVFTSRLVKRINLEGVQAIPQIETLQVTETDPVDVQSQSLNTVQINEVFFEQDTDNHLLSEKARLASVVGTVLHRQLQWISENWLNRQDFTLPENWFNITCAQLSASYGFSSKQELTQSAERVINGIKNTLADDFGRIILSSKDNARCELVLHKKLDNASFLTRIIDRTFIYQSKRWIIDYKSSQPEDGESLPDFIAREKESYMSQLTDYFNMMNKLSEMPLIAGLYFPLIPHFEKILEI